jgi:DNA-directed RNA polymerase subunit RPC12/RpoP
MSQEKCPYCGGRDLVANIKISQPVEAGYTGLCWRTMLFLTSTEELLADLCTACGSVTRFHVQNTDRKWITANP